MSQDEALFDVFISYNSRDREAVKDLCRELERRQIRPFLDQEGLEPGERWLETLSTYLLSYDFIICFGPNGLGKYQKRELEMALRKKERIFPVLLPDGTIPNDPLIDHVEAYHFASITEIDKLAQAIHRSRNGKQLPVPEATIIAEEICPYQGLFPFSEENASFFFGRDDLVDDLARAVEKDCMTALIGSSGSGKSSVVYAGLLPRLRSKTNGTRWEAIITRPGPQPVHALTAALISFIKPDLTIEDKAKRVRERASKILSGRDSLSSLIDQALSIQGEESAKRLLLFVDQWEELYTLTSQTQDRSRFIDQLLDVACRQDSPITVLLAVRVDFYRQILRHSGLSRRLQGHMIHVSAMGRVELRAAVERPAARVGLSFKKGLVTEILNDIGDGGSQLPLLEFTLTELWKRRDKEERTLGKEAYEDLGRLQGAITKLADEVVSSLPDLEVVRKLFMRLVHVEEDVRDIRRRVYLHELDEATQTVVARMVDERLLVLGSDAKTGKRTVEVIHEALLRNWGRLQGWLKEDRAFLLWRERFEDERSAWIAKSRRTDFLLRKGPLEEAKRWYSERVGEFSAEETEYICESMKQQEAEEEEERRQQIQIERERLKKEMLMELALAVIVVLVAFAGGTWLLYHVTNKASDSRTIASEALQLKSRRLDVATLLSLEAGRIADTSEARSSLLDLVQIGQRMKFFLPADERKVYSAVFDGTGKWVASGGEGKIYIWHVDREATLERVINENHSAPINSLAFSPDGKVLASGSEEESQVRLYLLPGGEHVESIPIQQGITGAQNLVFSPDGVLLAYSVQNAIFLWSRKENRQFELEGHSDFVSKLAFNPEGTMLASAGLDQKVFLWSIPDGRNVGDIRIPGEERFNGIAFHPRSGNILAIAGTGIQFWDIKEGKLFGGVLKDGGVNDTVLTIAFSQDGRTLASAGIDSRIRLWSFPPDGEDGRPSGYLDGHGGNVWSLAFNNGQRLVSSGAAGEVIVWDLDLPPPLSRVIVKHSKKIRALALGSSSNVVAAGDPLGEIGLWNTRGDSLGKLNQHHHSPVRCLATAGNSDVLASGDAEGKVLVWNGRELLHEVELPKLPNYDPDEPDSIYSLALSSDGRRGAAGTRFGRLFTWENKGREDKWPVVSLNLNEESKPVAALAFDPVSDNLVAAVGTSLILWDPREGKLTPNTEVHDEKIAALAFRADGQMASGSLDGTVRLWKIGETLEPQGAAIPVPPIRTLAWSPISRILAAGGTDGTITLWDAEERKLIGSGLRSAHSVSCLAFRDDDHLISCSNEQVLEWSLRYEDWRSYACRLVNRSFSEAEWSKYLEGEDSRKTCPGRPIDNSAKAP